MRRVFVYGTLKKGYSNHYLLERNNVTFIGNATIMGYKLYHVATFPGMVKSDSYFDIVKGEVYEVDDNVLSDLDFLEDEGYLYSRVELNAYIDNKLLRVNCYLYLHSILNKTRVDNDEWKGAFFYGRSKRKNKSIKS